MYKIKAAVIVALLVAGLTGSTLYLSERTAVLSNDIIQAEHIRLEGILRDKLLNAENSLTIQANEMASNEKLIQELSTVHDRLVTTPPDELKKNDRNWNKLVYDNLLDWKKTRQSEISQHETTLSDTLRANNGSIALQHPNGDWWGKAPDLVLAFAAVPRNDGNLASILVAQGFDGKQLNAGLSYEQSYTSLDQINRYHFPQFVHFAWDRKMYLSVVSPVMRDGNYIGNIVVGYELSRDMINQLSRSMPPYVDLSLVHATPKFGAADKDSRFNIFAINDETQKALTDSKFKVNSNEDQSGSTAQAYSQIASNTVYTGKTNDKDDIALSRIRWSWDEAQETDVFIMTNHKIANERQAKFQTSLLIAGIIALVSGIILILLLISAILKRFTLIKTSLGKAILSGDPIDAQAMSLITGENAEDICDQYTIKRIESATEDKAASWSNLIMDFSDEANDKADAELAPEDKQKLKNSADAEEARPIYEEYMRLRKENHIDAPMDFDCFLRRLQRNAAKIKEQYHCEKVTFQVHVSDGNVLLKPKIVKK